MNILKKLLFSYRGSINRSDMIYGVTYAHLLFLVSIDIVWNGWPTSLIGSSYDIGSVAQYIAAIVGGIVSLWMYFAVIVKRLRALGISTKTTPLYICPFCVIYLLQKDQDSTLVDQRNHSSWIDTIFFFAVIIITMMTSLFLYRINGEYRVLLVILLAIATVMNTYFWLDTRGVPASEKQKYTGIDTWIDLAFVLVIVLFIRSFILNPFQIIGPSMEDSFHGGKITNTAQGQTYSDGEYILVDKMTYHLSEPKRGDVVVFTPNVGPEKRYLIKRIIGLPGDTIRIQNGYVWVAPESSPDQFIQLDESDYLGSKYGHTCLKYAANCDEESGIFHIPAGRYFLMGDNRPQSLDARKCFTSQGCTSEFAPAQFVPLSAISGLVSLSLGHFDLFGQILPYPTIGTLEQIIPLRWDMIQTTHEYPELPQVSL